MGVPMVASERSSIGSPQLRRTNVAVLTSNTKGVAILGSTGSIGRQALDVIARSEGAFRVVALCAGSDDQTLAEQMERFRPRYAGLFDPAAAARLREQTQHSVTIGSGEEALLEAVSLDDVDIVIVAVVGFAGLLPTLKALELGKRVALANKETLVAAGDLVMEHVSRAIERGVSHPLIPVDSEHSAIFQLIQGRSMEDVELVTLTASGGPFRNSTPEELECVTPEQALRHPTWNMGGKITIDSATLMNKGLEVIEAHHLFQLPLERIDVVVHPQSLVHSFVEFRDGSLFAQLAVADMRLPIAYALWYPNHAPRHIERLNLRQLRELTFEPPDVKRFPCLDLALTACKEGGTMPAVLNAANEIAVYAFLRGELEFLDIPRLIEATLEAHDKQSVDLETVLAADRWAREHANKLIQR